MSLAKNPWAHTPGSNHRHLKTFSETETENENYIFYDADKTDVPSCHGVVPELLCYVINSVSRNYLCLDC